MSIPVDTDTKYKHIIFCMTRQLRVFGKLPDGTNMTVVAKELFPEEFWKSFNTFSMNNTQTIELTEDIYLELIKKSGNVSAFLKLKVMGVPPVILAEWQD